MTFTCPVCNQTFARMDSLKRHMKTVHDTTAYNLRSRKEERKMIFQHPFTMTISGPTASGKTQWLKELLLDDRIQPSPQRILFFYKRWQPLYDEIKKIGNVEFMKTIPENMDDDNCIDPKIRNLVILDDMMTATVKDPRITNLFCEGSHHRNLSLITLNQNLYYGKDPTQRRNTKYLVLFKNPVDQTPVMSLAKQMYPGRPNA